MGILGWIIFGALVGWIASKIMKTDDQMGAVANIIVGIIGANIGGWVGRQLGLYYTIGSFSLTSIIMGVVGACILIFIVGAIRKNRNN